MLLRVKNLIENINSELNSIPDFAHPTNAHQLLVDALEFLEDDALTAKWDEILEERLLRDIKNPVDRNNQPGSKNDQR